MTENSTMTIRSMERGDIDDVLAIYTEGIEEGRSTFERTCPDKQSWDENHLKSPRLVATDEGKVIGFVVLSPISKRYAYRGVVEASIYITKPYRVKGIGKALMESMIKEAKSAGYWTIQGVIFANNHASLALFEHLGFRKVGYRERVAQDIHNEWLDTIMMEMRLPD